MTAPFAAAFAKGELETITARLLGQLPKGRDANLGILYDSEPAAVALPMLVRELADGTGIENWVGGVGLGVCAGGEEVYDVPAVVSPETPAFTTRTAIPSALSRASSRAGKVALTGRPNPAVRLSPKARISGGRAAAGAAPARSGTAAASSAARRRRST